MSEDMTVIYWIYSDLPRLLRPLCVFLVHGVGKDTVDL